MAPRRGGGGGLSRRAALALIAGGGLLGISSTGAFDQVDGQRRFDLAVDDDNALLGVTVLSETVEASESDSTNAELIEIQNRFSDTELTSIDVTSDSGILNIDSLNGVTLDPGETRIVSGTISASNSTTEVTLNITANTDSERIETTRMVTIEVADSAAGDCSGPRQVVTEQVNGDIENDEGTVEIAADVKVKGSVNAVRCVILREGAEIKDSVVGSNIRLGKDTKIDGSVEASGNVSLGEEAEIKDSVVGNDITLGKDTKIDGSVEASGNVILDEEAEIKDIVNAGGDVTLGEEAKVDDDVDAGGDVFVGKDAEIKGKVTADGSVTLEEEAKIDDDVNAGGDVFVGEDAEIKGNITADGDITYA